MDFRRSTQIAKFREFMSLLQSCNTNVVVFDIRGGLHLGVSEALRIGLDRHRDVTMMSRKCDANSLILTDATDPQGFFGLSDREGWEWASRWTALGNTVIDREFRAVARALDKPSR